MSLALIRAVLGATMRFALVAPLALACWAATALPGRAAEPDPYSATVTVDATAGSVVKARDQARLDGQRRALATVVGHLAGGSAKLPRLDDAAITNLVTSFSVARERMSAVRYVADYTFHFKPGAVKRLMANAGIAMQPAPEGGEAASSGSLGRAEAGGLDQAKKAAGATLSPPPSAQLPSAPPPSAQTAVLIPVFEAGGEARLWDDPNPWRRAWEGQAAAGMPRLIVPLGDAGDLAAIDAEKARAGNPEALAAVTRRNDAGEAVVAIAALQGPADKPTGVAITLRRYRAGHLVDGASSQFPAKAGESEGDLLHRAVAASTTELASSETGWKREPAPGYDQATGSIPEGSPAADAQAGAVPTASAPTTSAPTGSLTAVLPISGLEDWVRARQRIAAVPAIRKLDLKALSREEATIEIAYVGSIDELKASLARISLDLVRGGPVWHLARTGAGGSTPSGLGPVGLGPVGPGPVSPGSVGPGLPGAPLFHAAPASQ